MLSINTNASAFQALQVLNQTSMDLSEVQKRVSTGLRVSTAQDDAASYSISERMKGDAAGFEAVRIGLGIGDAALGIAIKAGESINALLIEMKAKSIQAQGGGMSRTDREALHNDVQKLVEQVDNIVESAEFNDVALIGESASNLVVLANADGDQKITISAQSMDTETLGIQDLDLTTSAAAAAALSVIENAISVVNNSVAALGSVAKQMDIQQTFTSSLIDQLYIGIGHIVDADMARESAQLQAVQIKQQLGVRALSIANSSPQMISGLFG